VEHELQIISGKVARDHVHVFFVVSPASGCQHDRTVAARDQLASTPSGVSASEEAVLGPLLLGTGVPAVSSETLTDEMVQQYIEEQEGEPVHDDSQFPIDAS
jgi:putative transposase